jgi:dihydroorotase
MVMPNLNPPVIKPEQARAYMGDILAALPKDLDFQPLMTLYLSEDSDPKAVREVSEDHRIIAYKLYPAHATTGSAMGVQRIEAIYPMLEQMEKYDVVLSVHAEVADPEVDVFDREARFIEQHLEPISRMFPALRIAIEHISTATAVAFTRACKNRVAATITAHHLRYTRNHLLAGGIRPHYYCAPILKRSSDREAIREAATSGESRFFMGTDSAPHKRGDKQNACGCAGCYTAISALSDYAEIFEERGALKHLEHFCSFAGADFYAVERNQQTITMQKSEWTIPETVSMSGDTVVPMDAGQTRSWSIV